MGPNLQNIVCGGHIKINLPNLVYKGYGKIFKVLLIPILYEKE